MWPPPPSVTHSPETRMGGGRERWRRRREKPALPRTPLQLLELKEKLRLSAAGAGTKRRGKARVPGGKGECRWYWTTLGRPRCFAGFW